MSDPVTKWPSGRPSGTVHSDELATRHLRSLGHWATGPLKGLLVAGFLLGGAPDLTQGANDEKGSAVTDGIEVTQRGGTRFISLKDWPVTREGSTVRPVAIEEYLAMKFGQVAEQLAQVARRLEELTRSLKRLEEHDATLDQRLRWVEMNAGPVSTSANGAGGLRGGELPPTPPPGGEEPGSSSPDSPP